MDDNKFKNQSWGATFKHAHEGCVYAFRTQRNFKVHILLALIAMFLAIVLQLSLARFTLLVIGIVFGLSIEMINTAVEKTVDLVTDQYHPTAKIAKDVSAGAMLVASIGLLVLGALLFIPPLWQIISTI